MEWMELALCAQVDTAMFFPGLAPSTDARKVCSLCEVTDQCLDFALRENMTHGVWGGFTGQDREKFDGNYAAIEARVAELTAQGVRVKDIAWQTGLSNVTARRVQNRIRGKAA